MSTDQQSATLPASDVLLPIRTVAKLTGINAVTLRAWERRYGILHPQRTPKGHRLYHQDDIDLIEWIVTQLKRGISISQVKQLIQGRVDTPHSQLTAEPPEHVWANYQSQMASALSRFDEARLDAIYNDALSLYPIGVVTTRLTIPLLKIIGLRWEKREGLVCEEHFFCTYLRNKIGARFHHRNQSSPRALKLICACLPGEYHELGLLLFALAAMEMDYQVIVLGANTPLDELPRVVQRCHADGIVLSGTSAIEMEIIHQDLAYLTRMLDIPVFVGGRISTILQEPISEAGAIPIDFEIDESVGVINAILTRRLNPSRTSV